MERPMNISIALQRSNVSDEFALKACEGIRALIALIGDDPTRDGVEETPIRVVKAFAEMCEGYWQDPAQILSKTFDVPHAGEIVMVRNIEFVSLCEHHMLPFTGEVTIGYLPRRKVVGLSKIARLVDCFSRRLQVQERMTLELANAIATNLLVEGVGVVVRANHSCMGCRGVRKPHADMVTSAMLGLFLSDQKARHEFLTLARM
jgi:GTP cyclohydrolase I